MMQPIDLNVPIRVECEDQVWEMVFEEDVLNNWYMTPDSWVYDSIAKVLRLYSPLTIGLLITDAASYRRKS